MVEGPLCPKCGKDLNNNLGFEIVDGKKKWTVKKSDHMAISKEVRKKYDYFKIGKSKVVDKKKHVVETEVKVEEPLRIFYCKSCGHPIHLVSDFDRCYY